MKKIFIIHGWTYSTDAWNVCIGLLKDAGYEPVMLHVPGLTEASEKVWTLDDYVEWLDGQLKNEKNVILMGHSNGGRIAIAFSERHPNRVEKLILVDAAGIYHDEMQLRMKRKFFGVVAKMGKNITTHPFVRKVFYKLIGAKDYERASPHMRETMAGLITRDLRPELANITAKTLIIWGKNDTATPVGDAYLMNELIDASELLIIPDAKHSPHMSHPKEVADAILAFL